MRGIWRLALRFLIRDSRSRELRVLALALVVAVASSTTIGFFSDRLNRTLTNQAATLIGGDLTLTSPSAIPQGWQDYARQLQLQQSRTLTFRTVVFSRDNSLLVSVKAVDQHYPLKGQLLISPAANGTPRVVHGAPETGTLWIEPRVLSGLSAQLPGTLEIGDSDFIASGLIEQEPDASFNFYSLAPRIIMNQQDVAKAKLIQTGSLVTYRYLFSGNEQQINALISWLKPKLTDNQKLTKAGENRSTFTNILNQAEAYLGLATLISILLAGVAIAICSQRYSERHRTNSALLRCLGAKSHHLLLIFAGQIFIIGLAASLLGVLLGGLAQYGLSALLEPLLPQKLAAAGFTPVIAGLTTGMTTAVGFSLPSLLALKRVPPATMLAQRSQTLNPSGGLVYSLATLTMLVLMWRYTQQWSLTLIIALGSLAALLLLLAMAYGLLYLSRRLTLVKQGALAVASRLAWSNLTGHPKASLGQIVAFAVSLMVIALVSLIRGDFINSWQSQLPPRTPNYFAINIQPDQLAASESFFRQHQLDAKLYPMVRGRLTAINDVPVTTAVSQEQRGHNALNRELNLTWSAQLPTVNQLVAGHWWKQTQPNNGIPGVSVEAQLAKNLAINLGDKLTFTIAGRQLQAQVTSLRQVKWDSFQPNFYMIFPPGTLDSFNPSYITSFYLPPEKQPLMRQLAQQIPNITLFSVSDILKQLTSLLTTVTFALNYLFVFVLLASVAMLLGAIEANLAYRLYNGALIRALGASRRQLRLSLIMEFSLLGLLAGFVAAISTELLSYLLYHYTFNLDWHLSPMIWLSLPLSGAVIVGLLVYWGSRKVVQVSPNRLLKSN
jgi:putative ABC transport system permease protein